MREREREREREWPRLEEWMNKYWVGGYQHSRK